MSSLPPDADLYGQHTRYSYHQLIPTDLQTLAFEGLVKYDHDQGSREVYRYPAGVCQRGAVCEKHRRW